MDDMPMLEVDDSDLRNVVQQEEQTADSDSDDSIAAGGGDTNMKTENGQNIIKNESSITSSSSSSTSVSAAPTCNYTIPYIQTIHCTAFLGRTVDLPSLGRCNKIKNSIYDPRVTKTYTYIIYTQSVTFIDIFVSAL